MLVVLADRGHRGLEDRGRQLARARHEGVGEELLEGAARDGVTLQQDLQHLEALAGDGDVAREPERLPLDVLQQLAVVPAGEGRLAREHLEEHGADAPQVGLGVVALERQDLGRHVERASAERLRERRGLEVAREPKVGDLQEPVVAKVRQ